MDARCSDTFPVYPRGWGRRITARSKLTWPLHSEFKDNLEYIVKSCLKKANICDVCIHKNGPDLFWNLYLCLLVLKCLTSDFLGPCPSILWTTFNICFMYIETDTYTCRDLSSLLIVTKFSNLFSKQLMITLNSGYENHLG